MLFGGDRPGHLLDFESVARGIVATVRRDVMRAGMSPATEALIEELKETSEAFRALWREADVPRYGEGAKRIRHPRAGMLSLEYSVFAVDGRPDLGLVVFNPATDADREKIRGLVEG
jgi:hypothetical protein